MRLISLKADSFTMSIESRILIKTGLKPPTRMTCRLTTKPRCGFGQLRASHQVFPPPAPTVLVGDQVEDLTVKLLWQDYPFPEDFETFRVLAAKTSSNGDLSRFKLLGEITFNELTDSQRFGSEPIFFFDTSFDQDGITKVYRVVAVDRFGVEAETRINATSPQLSPAPPQNVRAAYFPLFGTPRIDVSISWTPNTERDLAGYQIYATTKVGGQLVLGDDLIRRGTAKPKETSVKYTGEPLLLADQQLLPRRYFITAFDDTPRPDGSLDESQRVEVPLQGSDPFFTAPGSIKPKR